MTSISSSSPFAIPRLSASLSALAAGTSNAAAQSDSDVAPLQPKQVQPFDITKTDTYAQWQAEGAVAQDTQDLANTITAAFQSILAQRPDLADATFDFTGGKDGIKVISSALSDEDRAWLEKTLNANTALVDLVNRFNSDLGKAMDGAAALKAREASAPGTTPPKSPAAKVDGKVSFLALMQGVMNKAAPSGSSDDSTYTDQWDRPVDLRSAKTTSLAGMIDAKRQLDALQDGSIVTHLGNGRVLHGSYVDPDPYAAAVSIAAAFVPSASSTASLAVMVRAVTPQIDQRV
ncbi:hypothetical protein [Novosphingobium rosa]|uniref:hypothetical protein n=1 Tax=Novosphingobium rosa TaxID=76978 RepID=UPI00082EB249|nr:hypothetical protein [Novosphingobium rosa]